MYAENLISTPEAQADFYPTPKELGKKMVQGIDLGFISTVLEPSAGKGDLIRCLAEKVIVQENRCNPHTLNVDAIEIDPYIRSILKYEFGGARQQEIQHILREFEDRTRYDYKLNKEVGLNDEEKAARAQLKHESSLRDKISLHIVHDDFLTFTSRKTYDLILMNPPFSAGCEHLLKAIELLKCCGGKIRCLLNAETVRNPYSAQRQLLQQYLEEYGAEVEILADAFKDAERQTDVTVALVRIDIPRPTYHSEIYSRLKEASNIEQPQTEATELTLTDFLENIVQQFNFETDVGIALIREYLGMRPYLMESIPPGQYSDSTLVLSVGTDHRSRGPHINDFLHLTRRKYWNALFHNDKFMGKLTSELRQKYYDMVGKLVNYDFTLFNIQQISLEMNAELSQGIQDHMIISFAGADKLDLAPHLGGAAHAVLGYSALEISEALGCVVEVWDRLMEGVGRISGKLMLEIAERNGALVKILGRLHLLQADGVLHKIIDTPAAAIGGLVIRLFCRSRHYMERGTRRVSPALFSFFTQKIRYAADIFHQAGGVLEGIGVDLLQDVALCALRRRYREGIRLVDMPLAIGNRLGHRTVPPPGG